MRVECESKHTNGKACAQLEVQLRRLALVVGGGGGKGGAHLGTVRLVALLGLSIGLIVGASIGGVLGVLYAVGYSVDEIALAFGGARIWKLFGRDLSGMGLLGIRRVRSILEKLLGD